MRSTAKDKVILTLKYVVLIAFSVLCLYPLVWLFLSSFKTNSELYSNPWGLPESFSLANYIQAITEGHILQYFMNSVIIAVSAVAVSVLLGCMVSYAISRMDWKLSKITMSIFMLGMMIPVYAMVVLHVQQDGAFEYASGSNYTTYSDIVSYDNIHFDRFFSFDSE